ncbi:MAG: translocation/assembly module TamB [Prevotellaceae bacterium]|nr:translocation/assembly module TamB [Prevotellaceae bacterium]
MKKVLIIFCVVALALFLLPTVVLFTVRHPKVQKYLVDEAAKMLSDKLGTEVSVGSVHFRLFNRLVLDDVYVQSMEGDTLIFVNHLAGSITRIHFSKRDIGINTLRLTNAQLNLEKDTAGVLNLGSLLNGLKSGSDSPKLQEAGKKPFHLSVHNVEVEQLFFSYTDHRAPSAANDSAIDFKHIAAKDVSFKVSNLSMKNDTMRCHLDRLQLKERSGFNLHNLSGIVSVAPTFIEIKNLFIRDDFSDVRATYYRMSYEQFSDFTRYTEGVQMSADFLSSKVDLYTIAFFAQKMSKLHLNIGLTGFVNGPVSNLKGRDLSISFGNVTEAKVSFSMQGLPDWQNTFFTFDVKNLISNSNDFLLVDEAALNGKFAKHQALLRHMGALHGKARFTGFLSNFVADGVLRSDIGTLISDLSFAPAPDSTILINGTLGTDNFNLGKLLNDSITGKINFYGKVSGTIKNINSLSLNADLNIPMAELYGYPYRHTKLRGLITEKSFRGELLCDDPNMNFSFRGVANFEQEKSQFDFKLQLHHADFAATGVNRRDSLSQLKLEAVANIEGNNIDNFSGKLTINSAKYTSTLGEFPADSILVEAKHSGDTEQLTLKSDVLEASLKAKGNMANMSSALDSLLSYFVPAYHDLLHSPAEAAAAAEAEAHTGKAFPATKAPKQLKGKEYEYTFSLLTKNAEKLQQLLTPKFMVADSTSLSGCISSDVSCVRLKLNAPGIRYAGLTLSDINLNSATQDSLLRLNIKAGSTSMGNLKLQGWEMSGTLKSNLLTLTSSYKTLIASGEVKTQALFFENNYGKKGMDVELFPSTLALNDVFWNLSKSKIRIEDKRYTIDNFKLGNELQLLYINGVISPNVHDTLLCELHNLSIAPLMRTLTKNVDMTGNASGSISACGLLAPMPLFNANVQASAVTLFQQPVGDVALHTSIAENEKDVSVQLSISKDGEENLNVMGTLKAGGEAQATAKLNKLDLYHVAPLLAGTLSDIGGTLSGDLDVKGPLKSLLLNGELLMEQGQLKVDYLNAKFKMSGPVEMKNSTLQIPNMTVTDDKNTPGRLSFTLANITTPDKLHYALKVEPNKFHVFNTTERHNDYFFGQGYGTGAVQISGKRGETNINVAATTNDKTSFSILLSPKAQAQNSNFIDFVAPANAKAKQVQEEAPKPNLKVSVNLNATSDAELMLALNPNTGNVIKAAGNGNIKFEIEPAKNIFRMFGSYVIQRGEYSISIQNLVSKKFKIDNGSAINFNGEIAAATANIQATYKVRAPLADLFSDTTGRYDRAIPIDCKVSLTGSLTSPELKFTIEAPTTDNETKDRMQAQLNTEDNLTTQFLSLLLIDRFMPQQDISGYGQSIGGATLGGIMSSQVAPVTDLVSQVFNANVGFTVASNTTDNYNELDFGWGVSFNKNFTDRVTLSANLEHQMQRKQQLNPNGSEYLSDIDLEVMVDKSGRVRLKAFSHTNDQYTEMVAGSNRYGVGVFYQEDFDSFADLWKSIFGGKKNKKKTDKAPTTPPSQESR